MSNIFFDLDAKSFNTDAIAPCILNNLSGYSVDDKQEIRELVDAITFRLVEQDIASELKAKFGKPTAASAYFDLVSLRDMQEDIVNSLDNRAKGLMIDIYSAETVAPFMAIIDDELRTRVDLLGEDVGTGEDNGSKLLRSAVDSLTNRELKQHQHAVSK